MLHVARRALPELGGALDLGRITCDVHVIRGSKVEGGGHCPKVELPALTSRAIDEVAARVGRSVGAGASRPDYVERDGAA